MAKINQWQIARNHKIKVILSKKLNTIYDKSLQAVVRNIIFTEATGIRWEESVWKKMKEQMPELDDYDIK